MKMTAVTERRYKLYLQFVDEQNKIPTREELYKIFSLDENKKLHTKCVDNWKIALSKIGIKVFITTQWEYKANAYYDAVENYIKEVGTLPQIIDIAKRLNITRAAVCQFIQRERKRGNELPHVKVRSEKTTTVYATTIDKKDIDKIKVLADKYKTTTSQIYRGLIKRGLNHEPK